MYPGLNQYLAEDKCLAQGHNTVPLERLKISSQALYHVHVYVIVIPWVVRLYMEIIHEL